MVKLPAPFLCITYCIFVLRLRLLRKDLIHFSLDLHGTCFTISILKVNKLKKFQKKIVKCVNCTTHKYTHNFQANFKLHCFWKSLFKSRNQKWFFYCEYWSTKICSLQSSWKNLISSVVPTVFYPFIILTN